MSNWKSAFINGKIYTVDKSKPWTEAILVGGNQIIFTGTNDEIKSMIDSNTEVIDLSGKLVLPGFIDSHAHIVMGGQYLLGVDLQTVKSINEFKMVVKNYTESFEGKWITGGNWNHENWEGAEIPKKEWIDEYTLNIPVFVSRMDYHMALANSKALELAGINKDTPDPDGGTIVRNPESGEPTGILKDKAMDLIYNILPEPTETEYNEAITAAMYEAKRFGVTSIHDISYKNHFKALQNYDKNFGLTCRVYSRLPIDICESIINSEIQYSFGSDKLRIGSIKAFADGSLGSATALMNEAYSDDPGNCGLAMDVLSDGRLEKWAMECDKNKLQMSIHAIGDKANNVILNLAEKITKENPKWDRRFRIEHAQHLTMDDLARFSKLDIIASVQPYHLFDDGCWAEKKLGVDRLHNSWAFKSLIDSGAKVCFGSDWSVATLSPIKGIYAAVTRHTADGNNPDGFIPKEKVSVEEAIDCYTVNGAFAAYMEDEIGTIEAGKFADFVVLSNNIFEMEPADIKNAAVEMTVFDGKIIYQV